MRLITLRGDELATLTVTSDDGLRVAMQRMNETGRTLLVVVDEGRLVGVLADGDIRRFLASGGTADQAVALAINRKPTTLPHETAQSEVRGFMARRGFEYLPLVRAEQVDGLCILEHAPRMSDLSAVIMAGGLGTRLAPLTDSCPKPLLPLAGKPILSHIIDHLREQGVHRFVLSVNHLSHLIVDHYDDGSGWDCYIDYVQETERLGTGGSLSLIDVDTLSDPFLCLNGDVIHDVDIGALHDVHQTNGWDATMVVLRHSMTVPYGVVESTAYGEFVEVREKPVESFQINAGIYMLSKRVLDAVPHNEYLDMPTLFGWLAGHGLASGTYEHRGRWIDVGTLAEFERAQAIFDDAGGTA